MKKLKRVLVMAGGTGGHVFPGLAAALYFQDQGVEVHWLGTENSFEAKVVPDAKIPFHTISIGGLRGKGLKTLFLAPIRVLKAIRQANKLLQQIKPDVVIGMGGYASGPGGVASWLSRIPLVIHEQNAKAGFTNRLLARVAKRVLQGFPDAFPASDKVMTIGNPVRREIEAVPTPVDRLPAERKPLRLLVLGGSLGAKAINQMVPASLALMDADYRPEVFHQTGEKHFEETRQLYDAKGLHVNLVPFVKDMANVYAWADVVLCRAGALTVAELCTVGLGAIFVPFPHAVDDHQTANAEYMVKHHAAYCVQQCDLSEQKLADMMRQFAEQQSLHLAMAKAAFALRHVKVTERIYQICEEISP